MTAAKLSAVKPKLNDSTAPLILRMLPLNITNNSSISTTGQPLAKKLLRWQHNPARDFFVVYRGIGARFQ